MAERQGARWTGLEEAAEYPQQPAASSALAWVFPAQPTHAAEDVALALLTAKTLPVGLAGENVIPPIASGLPWHVSLPFSGTLDDNARRGKSGRVWGRR